MRLLKLASIAVVVIIFSFSCTKNDAPTPDPPPVEEEEEEDPEDSLKVGLVAYYPFNGNSNDISGNNLHGSAVGTINYSTNRYFETGSALELDGTNYISVPDNAKLQLKKSMTIYMEFMPETNDVQSLMGKRNINAGYNAFHLALNYKGPVILSVVKKDRCSVSNVLETDWSEMPSEGESPFLVHCWNYVAATFDGTSQKIYLNGKLVASQPVNFGEMGGCSGTDLRIGYWWNGDKIPFKGKLDEVRIYDRALSSTEINKLYKL